MVEEELRRSNIPMSMDCTVEVTKETETTWERRVILCSRAFDKMVEGQKGDNGLSEGRNCNGKKPRVGSRGVPFYPGDVPNGGQHEGSDPVTSSS